MVLLQRLVQHWISSHSNYWSTKLRWTHFVSNLFLYTPSNSFLNGTWDHFFALNLLFLSRVYNKENVFYWVVIIDHRLFLVGAQVLQNLFMVSAYTCPYKEINRRYRHKRRPDIIFKLLIYVRFNPIKMFMYSCEFI